MQSFKVGAFLVFFGVFTIFGVMGGGGGKGGCLKDFKNIKVVEAAVEKCKAKLNLTADCDMMPPLTDIIKNGYDDKCLMNCSMTEIKYVKDDGTLDFTAIQDDFNKNAPSGKADALVALMKNCSDTTAKDPVISKDKCKSITKTKICFMMGQETLC